MLRRLKQRHLRNQIQAVHWYRQSAEQGFVSAQANLAVMLASGEGTATDTRQAADLFRKAAKQGHGGAQFNLSTQPGAGKKLNYELK